MKTLGIAAGLFFTIFGALLVYSAFSGAGHEYGPKFFLPIDTQQMPAAVDPPAVVSQPEGTDSSGTAPQGRASAPAAVQVPERPPVQLGGRTGAASEAPPQD